MATTRNQEIINLQAETKQHKETIQKMTSEIASINSKVETFTDQVKEEFDSINGILPIHSQQIVEPIQGPPSSDQPSHLEGAYSSHTMAFHSNSLHHDPHIFQS
jgi:hypothetical protein